MATYHVTKTVTITADSEEEALALEAAGEGEDYKLTVEHKGGREPGAFGCPKCGRTDAIFVSASAVGFVDLALNGGHVDELEWGALYDVDIGDAKTVQCHACKVFIELGNDNELYDVLNLDQ